MPVNVNDCTNRLLYLANDSQQGRITPLYITQVLNVGQANLLKNRLNIPPGTDVRTFTDGGFMLNSRVHSDLLPFTFSVPITVDKLTGQSLFSSWPANWWQVISIRKKIVIAIDNTQALKQISGAGGVFLYTYTDNSTAYKVYDVKVKFISQERWASRTQSSIITPNPYKPIFTNYAEGIQCLPYDLGDLTLDYLVYPPDCKWAYTIQNGMPVYDPANSIDLQWDISLLEDLANWGYEAYKQNVGKNVSK